MARLNSKLRSVAFDMQRERVGIAYWCPGCDESHAVCTKGDSAKGPRWEWDGSIQKPNLSPSIKITSSGDGVKVCHCFIRQGRIEFCADSTHALAGKTVDLPDWPDDHDEATFYLDQPPHDFNHPLL